MATMKVNKAEMQEFENRLEEIESGMRGEAIQRILNAGADACVKVWKESIERHRHVVTGKMRDSVAADEAVISPDGAFILIYPQGNRTNQITNRSLAHIISAGHGRKQVKSGDNFVDEIHKMCERPAHEAMRNELNKIIGE